ncbi:twin-arginine translocation signal domain-containing protein, partial [Paracoccus sp. (in: a-proteobacteria)]
MDRTTLNRRNLLQLTGASALALGAGSIITTSTAKAQTMTTEWDKTFP